MRSLFMAFVLGATLLVPSPCSAQLYGGVYAGGGIPHDADTKATNTFLDDTIFRAAELGTPLSALSVSISDTDLDGGVMVGARLGYWLEAFHLPFFGVEAEVCWVNEQINNQEDITLGFDLETAGGVTGSETLTVPIQEADFDVVTVGFNALFRYPVGPLQPYGGAGIGIVMAELDDIKATAPATVTTAGLTLPLADRSTVLFRSDTDTAPALQVIGGLKGFLNDHVALFAEYKYVLAELEFLDFEMDYTASHVYGGIEVYLTSGVQQQP